MLMTDVLPAPPTSLVTDVRWLICKPTLLPAAGLKTTGPNVLVPVPAANSIDSSVPLVSVIVPRLVSAKRTANVPAPDLIRLGVGRANDVNGEIPPVAVNVAPPRTSTRRSPP